MRPGPLAVTALAGSLLLLPGCSSSTGSSATPASSSAAAPSVAPSRDVSTVRACIGFLRTTSIVTGQAGISTDSAAWAELARRLDYLSSSLVEEGSARQVTALADASRTISERLGAGDTDVKTLVAQNWNPPATEWQNECTDRGAHMVPALQ